MSVRDKYRKSRRDGVESAISQKTAVRATQQDKAIALVLAKQKAARLRRAQGDVTEGVQLVDMAYDWR